jgi:hypothetical protein
LIQQLHFHNFQLWHSEDEARRRDVSDAEIARHKRDIDKHNQLRNDTIEKLDKHIADVLARNGIEPDESAEMNSETPGSIVDRLSILSLKIYHMKEETKRDNAGSGHTGLAQQRLHVLNEQSRDLVVALDKLLAGIGQGIKRHKIYHQFKMYNDPRFNPALYREKLK